MSRSMVNPLAPLGTVLPSASTRIIVSPDLSAMLMSIRIVFAVVLAALSAAAIPAQQDAATSAATILVFGDSLSAGYGLPQESGWTSLLEKRLRDDGFRYRVANASITGETTDGGRRRIDGALKAHR